MNNETENILNKLISGKIDTNLISDGYHTFGELYHHRTVLYIALCRMMHKTGTYVWRSELHSDGTKYDGWFLLGICQHAGEQITYHLHKDYWDDCAFAYTRDKAPEFDGHSSKDVLERVTNL